MNICSSQCMIRVSYQGFVEVRRYIIGNVDCSEVSGVKLRKSYEKIDSSMDKELCRCMCKQCFVQSDCGNILVFSFNLDSILLKYT